MSRPTTVTVTANELRGLVGSNPTGPDAPTEILLGTLDMLAEELAVLSMMTDHEYDLENYLVQLSERCRTVVRVVQRMTLPECTAVQLDQGDTGAKAEEAPCPASS